MGAPAIAKPRPARRSTRPAPSRTRPAPRSRPRPKSRPASARAAKQRGLTPVAAVGRTAVAVGGIADSGFVVRMARGRMWIGVLAILLGGIVAINVWGLGLSAGSSDKAAKIDELQRTNSVLHSRLATKTSNDRIAAAAGDLGLKVPAPDAVHYIGAGSNDAERAAERLTNGKIQVAPPPVPETVEEQAAEAAAPEAAVADPAAVPPTDPTVAATTPVDPATGLPLDPATGLPVDPAATAVDPATGLPVTP